MSDCAAEDANFPQTTQTEDLSQQIAAQKARLAEQERLLHSVRLRFKAYSNASLYAFERRERRAELWHKIVEQPHEKYLDSGHLPDGSSAIVDLVLDPADESKVKFICYEPAENEGHKEAPQIAYSEILADSRHAYLPPQVDPNLLTSIRMPIQAEPYESLQQLISGISTLILRCVPLSETDARLLAHFVLSTWLIATGCPSRPTSHSSDHRSPARPRSCASSNSSAGARSSPPMQLRSRSSTPSISFIPRC
jgi:hypothetical protein